MHRLAARTREVAVMENLTRVYAPGGVLLGLLPHAKVAYTLKDVPLSTAEIVLPVEDPGNEYCQMFNEVEIFDGGRRVELFRIISSPEAAYLPGGGGTVTYQCEHVLGTLMDNVLFQYHEVGGNLFGGSNEVTRECIEYVLARQSVPRWKLGACEFQRQYQYSWENETLLRALLSIAKPLDEEYLWTYDTTQRPWTINLVKADSQVSSELRYARNMAQITKEVDASDVVTRLYPLGYGEGVNQLTIRDVNGGVPYLDVPGTENDPEGRKERVWQDGRFEIAASLLARAKAILQEQQTPYYSYSVQGYDLYPLTGDSFDLFVPGRMVRVNDQEDGILITARVREVSKKDVLGAPGDVTITIANKARSAADAIASLADRASINELHAQGATVVWQDSFADNADKDHPIEQTVEIPAECVRINKLRLTWTIKPFRNYSRGAEAGGGSTATSSAGGGSVATSSAAGASTRTSSAGGSTQVTVEQRVSSTNLAVGAPLRSDTGADMYYTDNNSAQTTSSAGGHLHTVLSHNHSFSDTYSLSWGHTHSVSQTGLDGGTTGGVNNYALKSISISGMTGSATSTTSSASSHSHTVAAHNHYFRHFHTGAVTITVPGQTISIPSHTHTVQTVDHTHNVSIDSHMHTVEIPTHSHDNIPGIYDGPSVSSVTITVDNVPVPADATGANELDLTPYLSKDEAGKILRNVEHKIVITPNATEHNAEGLARLEGRVFVQTFIRSQGGGDY